MKKVLLSLAFMCVFFITAFGQADKITLNNGKTVEGSIVKVTEFTVIFKYVNEDAEQTVSKYLVEKIVYGKSGRVENLSPKIVISSEDDWEKVIILEDNSATAGLTKVGEIKGKTSLINYRTASGNDRKAEEKLKKEAAKHPLPNVYFIRRSPQHLRYYLKKGDEEISKIFNKESVAKQIS